MEIILFLFDLVFLPEWALPDLGVLFAHSRILAIYYFCYGLYRSVFGLFAGSRQYLGESVPVSFLNPAVFGGI